MVPRRAARVCLLLRLDINAGTDGGNRVGGDRDVLLLSVRAAVRARSHGSAAIGCIRPVGARRRVDGGPLLQRYSPFSIIAEMRGNMSLQRVSNPSEYERMNLRTAFR